MFFSYNYLDKNINCRYNSSLKIKTFDLEALKTSLKIKTFVLTLDYSRFWLKKGLFMKRKASDYISLAEVGERLEGVRLIFGLDLVEICELLETTKYFFNEVKRGRKLIPYEWVMRLSEKYNLNQNWIYQGEGEIFSKRRSDA